MLVEGSDERISTADLDTLKSAPTANLADRDLKSWALLPGLEFGHFNAIWVRDRALISIETSSQRIRKEAPLVKEYKRPVVLHIQITGQLFLPAAHEPLEIGHLRLAKEHGGLGLENLRRGLGLA